MIDVALPCSCCGKNIIDYQSLNKGGIILGEKCIRKPFQKGKPKKRAKHFCSFHRKFENAFFTPIKIRFFWIFKRKIYICSKGWSELFASCRKDM